MGKFCDLILNSEDYLDYNTASDFINQIDKSTHNDLEKNFKNAEKVEKIVNLYLLEYIQRYCVGGDSNSIGEAFEFDNSSHSLMEYKQFFISEYVKNQTIFTDNTIKKQIPKAFDIAFSLIQEKSDHYREFEQFYLSKELRLRDHFDKYVESKSKEIASKVIDDSSSKALEISQKAEKRAIEAVNKKAKEIKTTLSQKTSETSVTIFGIFAGIVLTVVAGLLYSSSVIESINSASIPKLMLISTLVGFICVNIIAVMFHYIDMFRTEKVISSQESVTFDDNKRDDNSTVSYTATNESNSNNNTLQPSYSDSNKNTSKNADRDDYSITKNLTKNIKALIVNHTFVFLLNMVLVFILVISIALYVFSCYVPSPHESITEQTNSNISVDVNISKGDTITTDSDKPDSSIDTTSSDKNSSDETTNSTLSDMANTPTTDNIIP